MHRVHAPGARPPSVVLSRAEGHHVTRVLRLGAGDAVVVFDGRGREWLGQIAASSRAAVVADLIEERAAMPEPRVHVTVGVAILKGPGMDTVVRDATMMGASAVAPFVSAHVALAERAWRRRPNDRAVRIAVASAKQCGRAVVPDVRAASSMEALVGDAGFDLKVVAAEPGSGRVGDVHNLPRPAKALILVGPEGGWSPDELTFLAGQGARFVGLGPRTLRAETAPIVILSALWTHWGWV
jgi:16S rRNA (uracil1498-N3)-methyltransferase